MGIIASCGENGSSQPPLTDNDSTGISTSGAIMLQGNIVVIPPPALLSHIITSESIPFESAALSDPNHPEQWIHESKKALNLGVLGADLSYVINHKKSNEVPIYLAGIRKLTEDLGISQDVKPELLNQIEAGINDPHLMLGLQSVFFHNLEDYLKAKNRNHINTCILLGGWVESLHHLASTTDTTRNTSLHQLLAEQCYSVQGIRALANSIQQESLGEVKNAILSLCYVMDRIPHAYEYNEPLHNSVESISYLRSNSNVQCTPEILAEVIRRVGDIRKLILTP
ncbi:MAG: hypothetical protein ACKOZM_05835 [Flavobacteriales bacterium]